MFKSQICNLPIVILLLFFYGCEIDTTSQNSAPEIVSLSAEPSSIEPGGTSIITCFASDTEGDSLYYSWSTTCGEIQGAGSIVTYTAPLSEEICSISCTVSDPDGGEATQSISIVTVSQSFDWIIVPAGPYTFGIYGEMLDDIDYDFEIMKYEVTNIKYVHYLTEALGSGKITVTPDSVLGYYEGDELYGAGNKLYLNMVEPSSIQWDGSSFTIVSGYEDHPVVSVTWFGANAFANHYGLGLPTENEWEKAARGNTGYDYPWGDDIDGSRANYVNSGDPYEQGSWAEQPQTTPVGFYDGSEHDGFQTVDSPSMYGVYDMIGNAYEWCSTWYSLSYYYRDFRGGSWSSVTNNLPAWLQYGLYPHNGYIIIGFRCVRYN
ncbi:MAG: SUMF1/EgtB/PvdO family nonheme iron enzyme [Fidelibacterota bacterium]